MHKNPEAPSLPRRLGRFLRRQWPLVVFVLVALGSRCLTPVLWHGSRNGHLEPWESLFPFFC